MGMDRKKLVIIIENNMYGDCTIGEFERSVINKTVNEILSLTTDREKEVESTIDDKTGLTFDEMLDAKGEYGKGKYIKIDNPNPEYFTNFVFHSDGKECGRLEWDDDKLTFTGNAEESAKIFIDYLRKVWGKPDREKELEKMVEHEKRRADDLHGRRIYELEKENEELRESLSEQTFLESQIENLKVSRDRLQKENEELEKELAWWHNLIQKHHCNIKAPDLITVWNNMEAECDRLRRTLEQLQDLMVELGEPDTYCIEKIMKDKIKTALGKSGGGEK